MINEKNELNLMVDNSVGGFITLQLHYGDIMAILEILNFANAAANLLYKKELQDGSAKGSAKMLQLSKDATELHNILFKNLDIGEPELNKVN